MKRTMASMLILSVLSLWIPCASAEISQDLDPMVSPEVQATVTSEGPVDNMAADTTDNAAGALDTVNAEKKIEEPKAEKKEKKGKKEKKEKKKKKEKKEKKKKKPSSKSSKKHKKSSN